MEVKVGEAVVFVDRTGKFRCALITAVWGKEIYPYEDGGAPSINVVLVSDDPAMQDPYGRQTEHETSVPHVSRQGAPGYYWCRQEEGVHAPTGEVHT